MAYLHEKKTEKIMDFNAASPSGKGIEKIKKAGFLCVCCALAMLVLAVSGSFARGEGMRKLTLMIYMCGSNLESHYGSATGDILEMIENSPASRDVSVLVMAGGSDVTGGSGYFQSENTSIYEIGNGRIRLLWQADEAMNMGEAETLRCLLDYGRGNRPAENYALILWDHGGGPLEGVCWDETHGMDCLSLGEVTEALEAGAEQKLSWIGFDACLMGCLEVAGQMAPYADYMIASQETEPAWGWNYAFLREIATDTDGAATGRRIVDAYFEGQQDSGEILTMACVDLRRVQKTIDALDPVFIPIEQRLGPEQYIALSGLRMSTCGFGKADPGMSSTGFDLVDLRDLVSRLEENDATENLLELLEQTVVYSRANEEGAGGLSLYHPYVNKTSFRDPWKETYLSLPFSSGYQQYVTAFGDMLTGEALFRWMDLFARATGRNAAGEYTFDMELTSEQAENLVSAQALILRDNMDSRLDKHIVLLATCPAELGADGVVRASWDGQCLFVEKEDGNPEGPIPIMQTDDGRVNTVLAYYVYSYDISDGDLVLYEMDAADRNEYPQIKRIRTKDEATGSFSSRTRFSEEEYRTLMIYNFQRSFPKIGANQTLPEYIFWENSEGVYANTVSLPNAWRFRFQQEDSGAQMYVIFRLVDSQQNVICSLPAAIPNEYRQEIPSVSGAVEGDGFRLEMNCVMNVSGDQPGLETAWSFEDREEEDLYGLIRQLTINDVRLPEDCYISFSAKGGQKALDFYRLGKYDTAGLDRLESITGVMSLTRAGKEAEEIPFCFTFDGVDLTPLQPDEPALAEAETDGTRYTLLGINPDAEYGWELTLCVENMTDEEIRVEKTALINGIAAWDLDIKALPAGYSKICHVSVHNTAFGGFFQMPGLPSYAVLDAEINLLQAMGETEMRQLCLISEGEKHATVRTELTPESPIPLGASRPQEEIVGVPTVQLPEDLPDPSLSSLLVLRENNVYRVLLRRVICGEKQICLSLEMANDSDLWLEMGSGDCAINGVPVNSDLSMAILPPHSRRVICMHLSGEALEIPGTAVTEIALSFYDRVREKDPEAGVLTVTDPFLTGEESWLNSERFAGETVRGMDVNLEAELHPQLIRAEMKIPESAASWRRTVTVDLAPEELSRLESGRIALVRPRAEKYLEVLTLQDWTKEQIQTGSFVHPGLIPTVAGHEEIGVWTFFSLSETGVFASVNTDFDVMTGDFDFFTTDEILWMLDWETNRAVVTRAAEKDASYGYQSDLRMAGILPLELLPAEDAEGRWVHLSAMDMRKGGEWYSSRPRFELEGKPIQLALRPPEAGEELYYLVSVTAEDGRSWSLPPIPYE